MEPDKPKKEGSRVLPCDGLVLAGGRSRRMGTPKENLMAAGTVTLLERARTTLKEVADGPVWIARSHGFARLTREDLPDPMPDRGPLAGLASGLSSAVHPLVAVLAVDLPGAPAALFYRLYQDWLAHPDVWVTYPVVPNGRTQPLAALWHVRALPQIREALAAPSVPRLMDVMAAMPTRTVPADADWLINLNTPDDLVQFQERKMP